MLTDTHSHLHFSHFKSDLPQVIERAKDVGINRILTLGTDLDSSRESVRIARENDIIFAAIGIHPTEINRIQSSDINLLKELVLPENKVVAIGEIGLDLYWQEVPLVNQYSVLEKMLTFSSEVNLPTVIHNRNAQEEMQFFFKNLAISQLKGVMHSFSGSVDDAKTYLELGLYISFTGVVTFKNFFETDVVKCVPLDKLLLETDCPFLAPVPYRGKRNEPAYVHYTAKRLAEIYQTNYKNLVEKTAENARRLFGW
jgi:TatD DNase family protein